MQELSSPISKPSKLFTRRHYIKIADTIHLTKRHIPSILFSIILIEFTRMFKQDNPNFHAATFHRHCHTGES